MEGKTNFSRRLKQLDGLIWLTVKPLFHTQIHAIDIAYALVTTAIRLRFDVERHSNRICNQRFNAVTSPVVVTSRVDEVTLRGSRCFDGDDATGTRTMTWRRGFGPSSLESRTTFSVRRSSKYGRSAVKWTSGTTSVSRVDITDIFTSFCAFPARRIPYLPYKAHSLCCLSPKRIWFILSIASRNAKEATISLFNGQLYSVI